MRIVAAALHKMSTHFADDDEVLVSADLDGNVRFQLFCGTEAAGRRIAAALGLEGQTMSATAKDIHYTWSGHASGVTLVLLVPTEVWAADHIDDFANLPEQGPFYSSKPDPTTGEIQTAALLNRYLDAVEVTADRSGHVADLLRGIDEDGTYVDAIMRSIERAEGDAVTCANSKGGTQIYACSGEVASHVRADGGQRVALCAAHAEAARTVRLILDRASVRRPLEEPTERAETTAAAYLANRFVDVYTVAAGKRSEAATSLMGSLRAYAVHDDDWQVKSDLVISQFEAAAECIDAVAKISANISAAACLNAAAYEAALSAE
jgi:hypothetical protein